MKKDTSQSITLSRFKILLIFITLVLIAILGYSIFLYQTVLDDKTNEFELTENRVNHELELSTIDEITRYHGTNYFHVVEGMTNENEQVVIYVNQTDQEADPIVFLKNDWVEETEIINQWEDETPYQDIHQIQYGIRNETPLLEFVYLDQSGRLSYDYYRLDNGEYDSGISFANKQR